MARSQSLKNLLYTNQNPRPETICIMCEPWIGFVFDPEYALPLPAHPGCYCTYYPSSEPVTEWKWTDMPQATRWRWVLYTAWLLRIAALVPDALRSLVPDAAEENERREDEEQGPAPPGVKPPKIGASVMSDDLTTEPLSAPRGADTNQRVRLAAGRVHLSAQAGLTASKGRRYDVTLIEAGINLNGWDMPAEVLAAALSKFSGAACLVDHAGWLDYPSVEKLAGTHEAAVFTGDAVTANLRLNDTAAGELVTQLFDAWLEDKEAGRPVAPVGLSADLSVRWKPREDWEEPRVAAEIMKVWSVDAVLHPAAGGRVERVLNSIGGVSPQGGNRMDEERILDQTPEGGAGDDDGQAPMTEQREARIMSAMEALQQQVADLMPEPEPEPDPVTIQLGQLTDLVTGLQEHVARQEEDRVVQGMGVAPRRSSISLGRNSLEQVQVAVEALIAGVAPPGDVRPLSGIRELYTMLSGDYGLTGVFDAERVWLANVTSATMAGLCADALNKRVVNLYQEYPHWWEAFVSPEDFSSLHDAKWITLGGVGELPTVAEGAAYTEMTWDDSKEESSFIKKGGYLGLTIEAIDKDDVNKLRSAPRALAQAAWLTMSKSISALFTANAGVGPNMADGVAVFNAAHANLGTTALSWASWVATRTLMRQQTELNSGERLGALTAGYYLLVPSDLEIPALQLIGSSGEPGVADNDINPVPEASTEEARRAEARKRVIVIDLWTDSNNWAAVAKPQLYPSIGLGFRFGRTPEIFSVASPTAGLMFSNDTMPIKVRFFFAVGVTNHRGLYKHNVA